MTKKTPFNKVLVANRGEIARRIIRSARAAGYRTAAVYSDADAGALHVREADQAIHVGPAPARESYSCIERLIEAAQRSGADAVHPGYGFLAENAGFARACREAGLVFIGPPAEAIAAMGDKAEAKRRMQAAGVPCIPGYEGEDQSDASLHAAAEKLGFPVMIKAAAGGGGRGMRLARSDREFADRLRSARAEARAAFGDDRLLLERAIARARHVEIQILADRYGNAVHPGERDCSVQRRHQKIIEEAPSPAVTAELRARMGAAAVAATKAIGYEGAGTLEFLLDDAGEYYFMEMNTRLQAEHPVTEALTGLDLVELQLRVASGEALALRQEDVRFSGHAIEVRLCAESPEKSFLPQSGAIALWREPEHLRVEHALESGATVPPHYDSMIAKLIAHGATREDARRRLLAGLQDTVALGIGTNQAFLARCLAHPAFADGGATTAFVDEHLAELLPPDAEPEQAALAALLLYATARGGAPVSPLAPRLPIPLRFEMDDHALDATVVRRDRARFDVSIGAQVFEMELLELEAPVFRFRCAGVAERAVFHRDGAKLSFHCRGRPHAVADLTWAATRRGGEEAADGKVVSATTGRVAAILVAVGDEVQKGQPLLTLEAMKMEHMHCAPVAGKVTAIHVAAGEQVPAGRLLAEIATGAADRGGARPAPHSHRTHR